MPIIIAVSVIGGLLIIAVLSMITCMIYKTMISPRTKTHDLEHVLKNEKSFTSVRSYKQYPPKSTTLTSEKRTPWCKTYIKQFCFHGITFWKMHTGTVDIILDKTSCSCFFYYWSPVEMINLFLVHLGFLMQLVEFLVFQFVTIIIQVLCSMLTKDGFNEYFYYPFLPCKIVYFPSIFMQDMCIFFFYFIL